jgi:hypothetical protein
LNKIQKHTKAHQAIVDSVYLNEVISVSKTKSFNINMLVSTYQQVINKQMAHALAPLGLKAFPQHKQRLATTIRIWLASRNRKDPTPNPVAMSES